MARVVAFIISLRFVLVWFCLSGSVVSEPEIAMWIFNDEVDEAFDGVVIAFKGAGVAAGHEIVAKGFDILARNECGAFIEDDAMGFAFIDEVAC